MLNAFFSLLRYEILGEEIEDKTKYKITKCNLAELYNISKQHDLAHLIGNVLEKNGLLSTNESKRKFLNERNLAVLRYTQSQYELESICKALNDAKINFVPLKGAVISQLYKEPWMRTSCDIDILVKEDALDTAISKIVNDLKYTVKSKNSHDVSLYSPSGIHLELHYKLNDNNQVWDKVLFNAWEYTTKVEGYKHWFLNEFFYFYHVAHMAEHFKYGGCGVRFFIDLLLIKKHMTFDNNVLSDLLQQGGLTDFNSAVSSLCNYWFNNVENTKLNADLSDVILFSGMYGDVKNRTEISKIEKGSKFKVLVSRIWLPYSKLKFQYPILQRFKILTPFYQIKRWFNLLNKNKFKSATNEFKLTISTKDEHAKKMQNLLKELNV